MNPITMLQDYLEERQNRREVANLYANFGEIIEENKEHVVSEIPKGYVCWLIHWFPTEKLKNYLDVLKGLNIRFKISPFEINDGYGLYRGSVPYVNVFVPSSIDKGGKMQVLGPEGIPIFSNSYVF